MNENKNEMANKDVAKKSNKVRWQCSISESTDKRLEEYEKVHGAFNRSMLVDILINEFLDNEENKQKESE